MRYIFFMIAIIYFFSGCNAKSMQNHLIYAASNDKITQSTLKSNKERAELVKSMILMIKGIDNATVVITGKTALIGIKTKDTDVEEESRLKKLAEDMARKTDQDIKNVAISTDNDIYDRIKTMEY